MMYQRFNYFYICIAMLLLTGGLSFLLRGGAGPAAEAQPGSGADPILTRVSLQQRLELLTAEPRRDLEQLQERLEHLAGEIRKTQDHLKGSGQESFPDMRGHPAEQAVNFLRERGLISGYPDGGFHPDERVTRAALAVMLAKAKNLTPEPASVSFRDLGRGHWAAGAIGAAQAAGYFRGYPDGSFQPDRFVTRAEAAAVLQKAFIISETPEAGKYRDLQGHWAVHAIEILTAAGIVDGYADNTFRPDLAMLRADMAAAFARILQR